VWRWPRDAAIKPGCKGWGASLTSFVPADRLVTNLASRGIKIEPRGGPHRLRRAIAN